MRSSYIQNNYGGVLYSLMLKLKPKVAVELGVLDGYSTIHIAEGIKQNFNEDIAGRLVSFDLFEKYPYNHGDKKQVEQELRAGDIYDVVQLIDVDGMISYKMFADNSIDFLHVDISNTGETLRRVMELWTPKLKVGSVIAFEGGSEERDTVTWMLWYEKEPIRKELLSNPIIKEKYSYEVLEPFPSMTLFTKIKE